jgi:hypothetical protein
MAMPPLVSDHSQHFLPAPWWIKFGTCFGYQGMLPADRSKLSIPKPESPNPFDVD